VHDAITRGIETVRAAGKAPGALSGDPAIARKYLAAGALFIAVGIDTTLLVRAARDLRAMFKDVAAAPQSR
jgi:4-hydroxy-2-oxoheptanedioate aldolase